MEQHCARAYASYLITLCQCLFFLSQEQKLGFDVDIIDFETGFASTSICP